MDLDTFTWFAVALALGVAALAVTAHVLATDDGLARIRAQLCAMVRHARERRRTHRTTEHSNEHMSGRSSERSTTTLEGTHHDHHDNA